MGPMLWSFRLLSPFVLTAAACDGACRAERGHLHWARLRHGQCFGVMTWQCTDAGAYSKWTPAPRPTNQLPAPAVRCQVSCARAARVRVRAHASVVEAGRVVSSWAPTRARREGKGGSGVPTAGGTGFRRERGSRHARGHLHKCHTQASSRRGSGGIACCEGTAPVLHKCARVKGSRASKTSCSGGGPGQRAGRLDPDVQELQLDDDAIITMGDDEYTHCIFSAVSSPDTTSARCKSLQFRGPKAKQRRLRGGQRSRVHVSPQATV